ncbi:hypothetical protein CIB48_g11726 [Xylaria polymorpha]|nr:hypothetical protein CIB48_g11726 [Xylaria polymorpha]
MSVITVSSLERITASKLANLLLATNATTGEQAADSSIAIVDVRDDVIHESTYFSCSLHHLSPSLCGMPSPRMRTPPIHPSTLRIGVFDDLRDFRSRLHRRPHPHVSALPQSQSRRTTATLLRKLAGKETVVFHCALSQQRGPSAALQYLRAMEAAGKSTAEGGKTAGDKKPQKVFVLDLGFVGWQEVYGSDERLTEGYRKELWEEGY